MEDEYEREGGTKCNVPGENVTEGERERERERETERETEECRYRRMAKMTQRT